MVRPPCCSSSTDQKVAVKKGPWTPEEDIILVSYIQEHGPGNWRTVPDNTGLFRCSKSCRLRWTNYLRPGIKRGNFTEQEEKLIIHLQALLGNRWAAIASYLPQRTDNDIKNYWNTHLRKKLMKRGVGGQDGCTTSQSSSVTKGQWERRLQTDIHMAKQALSDALSCDDTKPNNIIINHNMSFFVQNPNSPPVNLVNNFSSYPSTSKTATATTTTTTNTTTAPPSPQSSSAAALYASSADNIAKLLQGWMKDSPKSSGSETSVSQVPSFNNHHNNHQVGMGSSPSEGFDSLFGFNSPNSVQGSPEINNMGSQQGPLSLFEKWLLEDGAAQGHGGDLVDMSQVGAGQGLF